MWHKVLKFFSQKFRQSTPRQNLAWTYFSTYQAYLN
jgi:hypothetical protein